jgi:hypothetical protein
VKLSCRAFRSVVRVALFGTMVPNRRTLRKKCDGRHNTDPRITELEALLTGGKYPLVEGFVSHDEDGTLHTHIEVFMDKLYSRPDSRVFMPEADEVNALVLEGTKTAGPVLRYVKSSRALKSLTLHRERNVYNDVNCQIAGLFFQAILDANLLEELHIISYVIIGRSMQSRAEFSNLLKSTCSLKTVRLTCFKSDDETRWLEDALRSNTSIERMEMHSATVAIVRAFASLPKLRELVLPSFDYRFTTSGMRALSELLSTTKSLDLLDLGEIDITGEMMLALVVGLRANQSLTRLLFHPSTQFPSDDTSLPTTCSPPLLNHMACDSLAMEVLLIPWQKQWFGQLNRVKICRRIRSVQR